MSDTVSAAAQDAVVGAKGDEEGEAHRRRSVAQSIRALGSGVGSKDIASFLTCAVLLSIILLPPIIFASIWADIEYFKINSPTTYKRIVVGSIQMSSSETAKFLPIMIPLFAVIAGIQAKDGMGSMFFIFNVMACLIGVAVSLLSLYLLESKIGEEIFQRNEWVSADQAEFDTWRASARSYFGGSLQNFLTFVSILLGLKVAERA